MESMVKVSDGFFDGIVGNSEPMLEVYDTIFKVADKDAKVLILGETGTGKELVARSLHYLSKRKEKHFVAVNSAGIPSELLESELFGYVKGAFTGASETREGTFHYANEGTIFFDEIGDMSLSLQAKILRVLQDGTFNRVGGKKTEKVDVRVIAATNKNLEQEIAASRFRQDLYYRLKVIQIVMPPLRQRGDDIDMLARFFANMHSDGKQVILGEDAIDVLKSYHWSGNVRELESLINSAVILYSEEVPKTGSITLTGDYLSNLLRKSKAVIGYQQVPIEGTIDYVRRRLIVKTLELCGGNRREAAHKLGISPRNLIRLLQKYDIRKGIGYVSGVSLRQEGQDATAQKTYPATASPDTNSGPYDVKRAFEILSAKRKRGLSSDRLIFRFEEDLLRFAYDKFEGDVVKIAEALGITKGQCNYRLKAYGIRK